MALTEAAIKLAMDAIRHRETAAQLRVLKGKAAGMVNAAKVASMDAVSHPETAKQAKAIRTGLGIGVYAAHIRQVDQEKQKHKQMARNRTAGRDSFGRDV